LRPNDECKAPAATISDSVVQLGFAMTPLGLCRVHLGDDERHLRIHADRARVVNHDCVTRRRDRRPPRGDLVGHVEHRDVHPIEDLGRERLDLDIRAAH
jgi:hypothetical protein